MYRTSVKDILANSCAKHPEKKAITFLRDGVPETDISYFELDHDTNQLANTLLDFGIEKGDRVVLFLPKSP